MLGTSDTAYIIAALGVALIGLAGIWLQVRRVHENTKSPNGVPTPAMTYESWKAVLEIREQVAEVREGQLAGWERAHADVVRADRDRARLEEKVDHIAEAQRSHHDRDERRFVALFRAVGVNDPTD